MRYKLMGFKTTGFPRDFITDGRQVLDNTILAKALADPRFGYFEHDDFMYNTNPTIQWLTEGTFVIQNEAFGVIRWASGAVAGNRAHIEKTAGGGVLQILGNRDFTLVWRYKDVSEVQNHAFVGLADSIPTAAVPPVQPNNALYFRKQNAGAQVNWFAVVRNGGVETAVDTQIIGQSAFFDFKIVRTGNKVEYFIGAFKVAEITTNIPASSLTPFCAAVTQEAVAKQITVDAYRMFCVR